jgi:hypothetical protein
MIAEYETVSQILAINNGSVSSTFGAHGDDLAIETNVAVPGSRVDAWGNEYKISLGSRIDTRLERRLIGWNAYRCRIGARSDTEPYYVNQSKGKAAK